MLDMWFWKSSIHTFTHRSDHKLLGDTVLQICSLLRSSIGATGVLILLLTSFPLNLFFLWLSTAYFVAGSDIGKFTLKAVDDNRTVNKSVHFRPENNLFSINELASLWEKKIKRSLPRITITEEDLLNAANGNNTLLPLCFCIRCNVCQTSETISI